MTDQVPIDRALSLYRQMYRSRLLEEQVVKFWNQGLITGEMHTSIGEEAIYAGVISQLNDGDALALDHRTTSPALMRGLNARSLILEFMGHGEGLCSGRGGHMHIFSKSHLLASSGIVGSSGPAATGFALAAQHLRPGTIAVAFFGEGAVNQGMMLESFNLASVLKLPVLFVCKDNGMAITTPSSSVTAGNTIDRAKACNMPGRETDGSDVDEMWSTTSELIKGMRSGDGPAFIQAHCQRPHGHFLGDPLLRIAKHPLRELKQIASPLVKSATRKKGAALSGRAASLQEVMTVLGKTTLDKLGPKRDPVTKTRRKLLSQKARIEKIENEVQTEIEAITADIMQIIGRKIPT
jgi:TPP-dependent pyruvate/acetoin dehydrogenase alpha subunit